MSSGESILDPTSELAREPDRVSRMAMTSLVLGLLSCLPVLGLVAAILGVVSLARIGRSEGRLGGRTFAAVGMTFGLITSILWLSLALGVRQEYANYARRFVTPASAYFEKVEAGDAAAARALFDPAHAPEEAAVAAFAQGLRERAGKPAGPLDSWEDFRAISAASRYMPVPTVGREYAGRPMRFERGVAFVLLRMVQGKKNTGNDFPTEGVDEVLVVTEAGDVLRLSAPALEAAR